MNITYQKNIPGILLNISYLNNTLEILVKLYHKLEDNTPGILLNITYQKNTPGILLNFTYLKNTPGILLNISFIPNQFVTPP